MLSTLDFRSNAPSTLGTPTEPTSFRLAPNIKPMGAFAGGHRSGWPFVVATLAERQSEDGMLVNESVELTFKPSRTDYWPRPLTQAWRRLRGSNIRVTAAWREPWIGMFHLPPDFPEWFDPSLSPRLVLQQRQFRQSLPFLRGAVVFSAYHAAALRRQLKIPVKVIRHPTEPSSITFDWAAFADNPAPKLVQIGWYLRNYRAIHQVSVPACFSKMRVDISQGCVRAAQRRTDQCSPFRDRPEVGTVEVVSWLPNDEYDRLLATSIMFLELFDASANNAVIEAIVRETPLVVNRHPAVVEYLGPDYPLFYDHLDQVPSLLEHPRIRAAHEHLRAMNKHELSVDTFIASLNRFIDDLRTPKSER